MPFTPVALRAPIGPQILTRVAWLNCSKFHWSTASPALWTLVLFVEHVFLPSVRSPEFPGKPSSGGRRFHGVARNDFVLYGVAARAFEQAMLKADGTLTDACEHHARRAVRTARALNRRELRTRRELIF